MRNNVIQSITVGQWLNPIDWATAFSQLCEAAHNCNYV